MILKRKRSHLPDPQRQERWPHSRGPSALHASPKAEQGGCPPVGRSLRTFLLDLGYVVHGWGDGTLKAQSPQVMDRLHARVEAIVREEGRRVSLVGWSLGGLIARHLTLAHPERIRCVITMGTMLRGDRNSTTIGRLSRLVNKVTGTGGGARPKTLRAAPRGACDVHLQQDRWHRPVEGLRRG